MAWKSWQHACEISRLITSSSLVSDLLTVIFQPGQKLAGWLAGELAAVYSFVFGTCCRCKSVMHLQQKWLAINLNLNGAPACVAKTVPAAWPSTSTSTFTTTNIYWFSFSFLLSFGPFLCVFLRGPLICSSARQICCRTSSASGGKNIDR